MFLSAEGWCPGSLDPWFELYGSLGFEIEVEVGATAAGFCPP